MIKTPFRGAAEKLSLANIQSEVSGVLERLWRTGLSTGPLDGQDYAPAIELREEPARFVLTAEVPGVNASMLDVRADAASVTITGEKPMPAPPAIPGSTEEEVSRVLQCERRFGHFRRTVGLPGSIMTEGVAARLTDGVLTVEMPKAPGSVTHEVRINVRREPAEGPQEPAPA